MHRPALVLSQGAVALIAALVITVDSVLRLPLHGDSVILDSPPLIALWTCVMFAIGLAWALIARGAEYSAAGVKTRLIPRRPFLRRPSATPLSLVLTVLVLGAYVAWTVAGGNAVFNKYNLDPLSTGLLIHAGHYLAGGWPTSRLR